MSFLFGCSCFILPYLLWVLGCTLKRKLDADGNPTGLAGIVDFRPTPGKSNMKHDAYVMISRFSELADFVILAKFRLDLLQPEWGEDFRNHQRWLHDKDEQTRAEFNEDVLDAFIHTPVPFPSMPNDAANDSDSDGEMDSKNACVEDDHDDSDEVDDDHHGNGYSTCEISDADPDRFDL